MRRALLILLLMIFGTTCWGYPLDQSQQTGIQRLEGGLLVQQGKLKGNKLPAGALLDGEQIELRLLDRPDLKIPVADPQLTAKIVDLLGEDEQAYNLSLLDLSDPLRPIYAEHRAEENFNPGSLGKVLIALGLFQALADRYPDDPDARRDLLRNRLLNADRFIHQDHHRVPFWSPGQHWLTYREIAEGDTANLWSWLDWMLSPSSNAAASMVLREYLLMVKFGNNYPVDRQTAEDFFDKTAKNELLQLLIDSLHQPMRRNGFDPAHLRQGGFFTKAGKKLVPGGSSRASTRSLIELVLKLEKGQLVDPFSSLELKKLLYVTEKRIRYASHPALADAAVYFKSGSLYRCQPEEGFTCGKYQGNKLNLLNSLAVIEETQGNPPLYYLVVVSSNVLKVNSAVAHQTLALRIHRLLQAENRQRIRKKESSE